MARGLIAAVLAAAAAAAAAAPGRFSESGLDGWQPQTFRGKAATRYALAPSEDGRVLTARCEAGASGLIWKERIDLARNPVLRWRWRVDGFPGAGDERSRRGDDFAARVYVVVDGGWAFWRTRSLVYVWAGREPAGSDWPSAYTDQAHVVALRSGTGEAGRWREERRDLQADFRRYFGIDPQHVDGVALMTDCDDGGGSASAAYGDLHFDNR